MVWQERSWLTPRSFQGWEGPGTSEGFGAGRFPQPGPCARTIELYGCRRSAYGVGLSPSQSFFLMPELHVAIHVKSNLSRIPLPPGLG